MKKTKLTVRNHENTAKLMAISAGHFVNDFYISIIQPISYAFREALSLTMAQQGFIAFIMIASGTWLQPLIGLVLNRYGKGWLLILSVVWISFWISISAIVSNYILLIMVLMIGGTASALYHPLGSSVAIELNKSRSGTSLSLFMTIGGAAIALTPLAIPFVNRFGLEKLTYFMIPGIITAFAMYLGGVHRVDLAVPEVKSPDKPEGTGDLSVMKWMVLLTAIAALKQWIRVSLVTYGIDLFAPRYVSRDLFSIVLIVHLILASSGVITGGVLSDRLDGKKVFLISMVMAAVSLGLTVSGWGLTSLLAFTLVGFLLALSNPINVVMARNFMPYNATFATGIIMGLGGGLGGLGALFQGYLGDMLGITASLMYMLVPIVLACILTGLLPAGAVQPQPCKIAKVE